MAATLAHALLGERLRRKGKLGRAVGFAGTVTIAFPELFSTTRDSSALGRHQHAGRDHLYESAFEPGSISVLDRIVEIGEARCRHRLQQTALLLTERHREPGHALHFRVAAGHDPFPYDLVQRVLGDFGDSAALESLADSDRLNMTRPAPNASECVFGVAKRHAETSRRIFNSHRMMRRYASDAYIR